MNFFSSMQCGVTVETHVRVSAVDLDEEGLPMPDDEFDVHRPPIPPVFTELRHHSFNEGLPYRMRVVRVTNACTAFICVFPTMSAVSTIIALLP